MQRERRSEPAPIAATPDSARRDQEERNALLERIARLESAELALRDSISTLLAALHRKDRVPASSTTVVELDAVDVYVERRDFASALELLDSVLRRLRAWSDSTGARHLALDVVDRRLHEVLVLCAEAAANGRHASSLPCRITW